MDIQPELLFIIVITCAVSVFITSIVLNSRYRKKINKLEKELLELNWHLLEVDNGKSK